MKILESLKKIERPMWLDMTWMVLLSNVGAPLDVLNLPPLVGKITVEEVTHHEAIDITEVSMGIGGGTYKYDPPRHFPKRTIIKCHHNFWNTFGAKDSIVIDHETNTVDLLGHHGLLHEVRGGSGAIGMYIFGIPGLILSSPILAIGCALTKSIEKKYGMDRYALNFYLKVKDQLSPEVQVQLEQAFKNNYVQMQIRMKEYQEYYKKQVLLED